MSVHRPSKSLEVKVEKPSIWVGGRRIEAGVGVGGKRKFLLADAGSLENNSVPSSPSACFSQVHAPLPPIIKK